MDKLKPCPFCGGEATFGKVLGFSCEGRCVKCIKCGAKSVPHMIDLPRMTSNGLDESTRYSEEQAREKSAEAWNRRVANATVEADIDVGGKTDEWIPVERELPHPFLSVLVYMPGERPMPTVREGFLTSEGKWYAGYFTREPSEVVAWMPMPEPPERGEWLNETD